MTKTNRSHVSIGVSLTPPRQAIGRRKTRGAPEQMGLGARAHSVPAVKKGPLFLATTSSLLGTLGVSYHG